MINEMTVDRVIDAFRELIRQVSDDSVYTSEFLYYILSVSRSKLMKDMMSRGKELSPWLYQRFCIKLCPSTFIECNCEPFDFGCTVYRSENPIPQPLWTGDTSIITISELWGDIILPIRENANRYTKYRKYKPKMYYMIGDVNGEKYLFVISRTTPPRIIKAEGVFEDPSIIDRIACTDDCPSPTGIGFPLDLNKHYDLLKLSFEMLGLSMKQPEDRSNNSQSTTKETTL